MSLRATKLILAMCFTFLIGASTQAVAADMRPNILWISCEDISSHLGCYGEKLVHTPTLDRLAARGVRYTHAFTTTPVCATNRSSIITGMYPTTLGSQYMRCAIKNSDSIKCFPEYLRAAADGWTACTSARRGRSRRGSINGIDTRPWNFGLRKRRLSVASRSLRRSDREGGGIRQVGIVNGDLGAETDGFPRRQVERAWLRESGPYLTTTHGASPLKVEGGFGGTSPAINEST